MTSLASPLFLPPYVTWPRVHTDITWPSSARLRLASGDAGRRAADGGRTAGGGGGSGGGARWWPVAFHRAAVALAAAVAAAAAANNAPAAAAAAAAAPSSSSATAAVTMLRVPTLPVRQRSTGDLPTIPETGGSNTDQSRLSMSRSHGDVSRLQAAESAAQAGDGRLRRPDSAEFLSPILPVSWASSAHRWDTGATVLCVLWPWYE